MPLILSHNNKFRGIFSQREILCDAIKKLMGYEDESYENLLLIRCPNGQIKFEREDGFIDRFCKFNYPLLCRELKSQSRVAIFDVNGEENLFAIWLSPMNEIYYSPKENVKVDIEEQSIPVIDKSQVRIEQPTILATTRMFGQGPKIPDGAIVIAN